MKLKRTTSFMLQLKISGIGFLGSRDVMHIDFQAEESIFSKHQGASSSTVGKSWLSMGGFTRFSGTSQKTDLAMNLNDRERLGIHLRDRQNAKIS